MKQIENAPGLIGWSLGADLFKLEFHTLSAWEDAASLRRFVAEGAHGSSIKKLEQDMRRQSIFVYYRVLGRHLPLSWKDAVVRQQQQDQRRSDEPPS